jgi:hypothetical protein
LSRPSCVERTTAIAALVDAVFEHVNDLHKWDAWSPWAKLDPDAKVAFEGPDAGKDAAMVRQRQDQRGKDDRRRKQAERRRQIRVDFTKPFEGSIGSEFGFKPNGEGIDVTWAMTVTWAGTAPSCRRCFA